MLIPFLYRSSVMMAAIARGARIGIPILIALGTSIVVVNSSRSYAVELFGTSLCNALDMNAIVIPMAERAVTVLQAFTMYVFPEDRELKVTVANLVLGTLCSS